MARIGRPPKDEGSRKSAHLSIRVSAKLRDALEADRRELEGNPSLSEVVALRLHESFQTEKTIDDLFGGTETRRILQVAECIRSIEISTGEHWFSDPFTYDQVKTLIDVIFQHFRPTGRRAIPKPMRWHPSLRKDVENLGRHTALLALSYLESIRDNPQENDANDLPVPVAYRKAALQLGSQLKGSPIDELRADRQQTKRRIWKYHGKRPPADAATEEAIARKVGAISARSVTVASLLSYLKPRLTKGATVSMAKIFDGTTGANFSEKKPLILKRIKAATKGKLVDHPDIDIDRDVTKILDAASKYEASNETIADKHYRAWQRRRARSASKKKGEQK